MGFTLAHVVEATMLRPNLRRFVFAAPDLPRLKVPTAADAAVGMYFPENGASPPEMVRIGEGWDYPEGAEVPPARNYSVRALDARHGRLTIDIVLHERGAATTWAAQATVGDTVGMSHARSWYSPGTDVDWQLLAADMSGLPALARIIEELPAGSPATAYVELTEPADLDYLPDRPSVTIVPSIGTGNGHAPGALADLIAAHVHPSGRGYCWFGGEAADSRVIRKRLRREYGWTAAQFDILGYWRFDSETWDRKFAAVGTELLAVYNQAIADGKGDKIAREEYDEALEAAGL